MKKIIITIWSLVLLGSVAHAQTPGGITVPGGGTGLTSIPQYGWLSGGGAGASRLIASTSPTVGYLTATSTSQASTFPYASTTALTVSGTGTTTRLLGNAQIDGALRVNGLLHAAGGLIADVSFTSSGNATIGGTLTVTGQTTLASSLTGYLKGTSGVVSSQAVPIPVADGGTGAITLTGCLTGNGTGAITGSGTCNTSAASVTSVAMTVPTFLSVAGSPITTSGTLAVTLSGTALPIANGGTNATSFTTTNNAVYWNGTSLLTAPLTSPIIIPYATTTGISSSQGATFATASGNVGIGTTSPSRLLSVAGTGYFTGNVSIGAAAGTGYPLHIKTTDSNMVLVENASADSNPNIGIKNDVQTYNLQTVGARSDNFEIYDGTNSQTRLAITTAGNVGIGTTVPGGQLHVKSSGTTVGADFRLQGAQTWRIVSDASTGEFANNALVFRNPDTGVTAMTILNTGNVGIGTTAPNGLLHVSNTTSASWATSGNATGKLIVGKTADVGLAIGSVAGVAPNNYVWMQGQALDSAGVAWPIVMQPMSGNVGIGTTGPGAKFHAVIGGSAPTIVAATQTVGVFQNSAAAGDLARLNITSGNTGTSILQLGDNDDDDIGAISYDQTSNFMSFRTNNVADRMVILSGGNVGIATTSPASTLDIGSKGDGVRTYLQIDSEAGAPAAGDCDSLNESGRMIIDHTNDVLYVCNQHSGNGWDTVTLTP